MAKKVFNVYLYNNVSEYWLNGPGFCHRHREDGPALITSFGQWWCIYSNQISCANQEEFERYIKLIHFQ